MRAGCLDLLNSPLDASELGWWPSSFGQCLEGYLILCDAKHKNRQLMDLIYGRFVVCVLEFPVPAGEAERLGSLADDSDLHLYHA